MKAESRAAERASVLAYPCPVCGAGLDRAHLDESRDGFRCVFCGALQEVTDGSTPEIAPIGVGTALREARERRSESLEVASRETRIHERFLQALEDDAPGETYPGVVYGRFFLREYAEYLGVDPDPLVEAFDRVRRQPDVIPLKDRSLPKQATGGSRVAAVMAAIALLVVAALSWTGGRNDGPLRETPASSPSAAATVQSEAAPPPPPSQPAASTQPTAPTVIRAVLRLVERSWVQATVDGRLIPGRVFEAGTAKTFTARRSLELTLGNGGGVRLLVNHRRVATGAAGQVFHRSFALRHGHLVA